MYYPDFSWFGLNALKIFWNRWVKQEMVFGILIAVGDQQPGTRKDEAVHQKEFGDGTFKNKRESGG